jgi:hypothetical protein
MWKYYLSKIINFLKFIGIFGFVFMVGNKVYAYSDNFDNYSSGLDINSISGWSSGTGSTTNTVYKSYPNSLTIGYQNSYLNTTNNFNDWSFAFKRGSNWQVTDFYVIYFSDSSTTTYNTYLEINTFDSSDGRGNVFFTGQGAYYQSIYPTFDLNTNWHTIDIRIEPTTKYLMWNFDNSGWKTSTTTYLNNASWYPLTKHRIYNSGKYINIDDLNSSRSTGDTVLFLNPTQNATPGYLNVYNYSSPITSPQFFNWDIDFSMSSSTIHAYPDDIPQILIQYENASSSIVNTVTMPNTDLSFNYYTPLTIYNVLSDNKLDFPNQTGIYTAEADLWDTDLVNGHRNYFNILASSTIQFVIATSTPITGNTAWCDNLCSDLDLGEATTSSFWSGLVPNLLNNGICAIRYGACYLFWPDSSVINQLSNTYNNFKISFPFNVYYDLASTTQNALATSTNMTGTFKMPFITKAGKATTITVLSSSSVPNLIGQTNSNLFRTTAGYLIWLITAGGIAFMAFAIL